MNRRLNKCDKSATSVGFILTELSIVVLVILLGTVSIPNMVKAWYDSQCWHLRV